VKFKFNVIEDVESPVADVYSIPRVQLLIELVVPAALTHGPVVTVGSTLVPYEPEPLAARENHIDPLVDVVPTAVDEIAAVPGTADFCVENDVAGAEITRAITPVESPTA
jgi:hypothetical protein